MNRSEFMFTLAQLLVDLPFEERSEALKFYNSYFDDAGPENEQHIIEELKSPEAVAQSIREGLNGNMDGGEFREDGFHETFKNPFEKVNGVFVKPSVNIPNDAADGSASGNAQNQNNACAGGYNQSNKGYGGSTGYGQANGGYTGDSGYGQANAGYTGDSGYGQANGGYTGDSGYGQANGGYGQTNTYGENARYYNEKDPYNEPRKNRRSAGKTVALVILCICALPVLLGVGGGLIGLVFSIFGVMIGVLASIFGGAIAGIFGGIAGLISGIFTCFSYPAEGLAAIGAGFFSIGGGILLMMLLVWICTFVIPRLFRWIKKLWNSIFGRRRNA